MFGRLVDRKTEKSGRKCAQRVQIFVVCLHVFKQTHEFDTCAHFDFWQFWVNFNIDIHNSSLIFPLDTIRCASTHQTSAIQTCEMEVLRRGYNLNITITMDYCTAMWKPKQNETKIAISFQHFLLSHRSILISSSIIIIHISVSSFVNSKKKSNNKLSKLWTCLNIYIYTQPLSFAMAFYSLVLSDHCIVSQVLWFLDYILQQMLHQMMIDRLLWLLCSQLCTFQSFNEYSFFFQSICFLNSIVWSM